MVTSEMKNMGKKNCFGNRSQLKYGYDDDKHAMPTWCLQVANKQTNNKQTRTNDNEQTTNNITLNGTEPGR